GGSSSMPLHGRATSHIENTCKGSRFCRWFPVNISMCPRNVVTDRTKDSLRWCIVSRACDWNARQTSVYAKTSCQPVRSNVSCAVTFRGAFANVRKQTLAEVDRVGQRVESL